MAAQVALTPRLWCGSSPIEKSLDGLLLSSSPMRPPVLASIFNRILNYGIVMLDVVNGVRLTLYQCFFHLIGLMDSSSLRFLVYLVLGLLP